MNPFKNAAAALWDLLDDIDTLDDSCRDDEAAFRARVRAIQKKREAWAVSPDARCLVWNVLDWHHYPTFGDHELHYAGELRAKVTKLGPKVAGAEPTYRVSIGGVATECDSLKQAMQYAENHVRRDAELPEVPCTPPQIEPASRRRTFSCVPLPGPQSSIDIEVHDDGSIEVDVGAEYGGSLSAAEATELANAIRERQGTD